MLKLYLTIATFIATAVFTMSSQASDDPKPKDGVFIGAGETEQQGSDDKPKAILHHSFNDPEPVKTDNQYTFDFFRMWLLDDMGKKVCKLFLQKTMGFDEQKTLMTIGFLQSSIDIIDRQTSVLYLKQQQAYIDEYNQGRAAAQKVSTFREVKMDRAVILAAEDKIQAQVVDMVDNAMFSLGSRIGDDSLDAIKQWIRNYQEQSKMYAPEIDEEEYLKSVAEPLNIIDIPATKATPGTIQEFSVIKKELK